MEIYKVLLQTTNALKDTAYDEKHNRYIDVHNGYIYVTKEDLNYVMDNYKWYSIEYVGFVFKKLEDNDNKSLIKALSIEGLEE